MTRETFMTALNDLDLKYVSEGLVCKPIGEKKKRVRAWLTALAAAAACIAVFGLAVWSVSKDLNVPAEEPTGQAGNDDSAAENVSTLPGEGTQLSHGVAISFDQEGGGLAEPSVRCGLCLTSTYSFFPFGEDIVIQARIGDTYSWNEKYLASPLPSFPSYSSYGKNGCPVFYVLDLASSLDYLGEKYGTKQPRPDTRMIINGRAGYYEKLYSMSEMEQMDIDFDDYQAKKTHCTETVRIQFDGYKEGEYGVLYVGFGWMYTWRNPYSSKAGESRVSFDNAIYYYVGKNGIYLSYISPEEANESIVFRN